MNESRNGMRSSLIAALLVGLLLFPAILPAGDAPLMRAENLGDKTLFTQPLLLAVANLDQRISTTTETSSRARLTHQRALVLERLTRTILFRSVKGFAAMLPADELERLRDIVSRARRSADKTAEMTTILRLNDAILDQSFSDLLTTVARDWIRFAPASDQRLCGRHRRAQLEPAQTGSTHQVHARAAIWLRYAAGAQDRRRHPRHADRS